MTLQDLYRAHARRLERMVARMLGRDRGRDAEDLVQDAFLRVYAAELGERTELSRTLLDVTARRLALNALRDARRRATDPVGDFDGLGVLTEEDPAWQVEQTELRTAVEKIMEAMPPQCRTVFRMRTIDGATHAEIGRALGISTKTVERHLSKGIRRCREELERRGFTREAGHGTRQGRR